MDLTPHHRSALIQKLRDALQKRDSIKARFNSQSAQDSIEFAQATEVEDFLNGQRINAIEKALTDNKIDY